MNRLWYLLSCLNLTSVVFWLTLGIEPGSLGLHPISLTITLTQASLFDFFTLLALIFFVFHRWFHPNLNRHQSEALLLHNGQDGSYLLRSSSNHKGGYSLSVRCSNSVKHFQIGWDGQNYEFGMGKFPNIEDFVSHFENKPLIGGDSGKNNFY